MAFAPQVTAPDVTTPGQVTSSAAFTPTANGLQIVGGGVTGALASQNGIQVSSSHAGQGAWTVIQWTTTGASQCSAFIAVSKTGPNPGSGTVTVTLGAAPVGESWFPSEIPDGFDPNNIAVGANSAGGGTTATTPVVSLTATPAAGDIVLATFASRNDPNLVTPASGFTAVGQANGTANPRVSVLREWATGRTTTDCSAANMGTVYNAGAALIVKAAPASTPSQGSASGGFTLAGSAVGRMVTAGVAAGTFLLTGTASGTAPAVAPAQGSTSGSTTWSGSASGTAPAIAPSQGSATGSLTITGTAAGSTDNTGTASGSSDWTGDATGTTNNTGTATGSSDWTGSALGTAPVVGGSAGSATGLTTWDGTSGGVNDPLGSADGGFTFTGTAAGIAPIVGIPTGTATGATTWTGVAHGINGSKPLDITLTGGTFRVDTASGNLRTDTTTGSLRADTITGGIR